MSATLTMLESPGECPCSPSSPTRYIPGVEILGDERLAGGAEVLDVVGGPTSTLFSNVSRREEHPPERSVLSLHQSCSYE